MAMPPHPLSIVKTILFVVHISSTVCYNKKITAFFCKHMKDHIKAFQFSLLAHIVVILFLFGISTRLIQREPVLVIDLSDGNSFPGYKQGVPGNSPSPFTAINKSIKTPEQASPVQPPIHEEPARDRIQPAEVQKKPQTTTLITGDEPATALAKSSGVNELPPSNSVRSVSNTGNITGAAFQGMENPGKALYLKKHFLYIRDIIQKNINYPTLARKMGWQGKVTISFLIMPDGGVSEIRIAKTSGKDILDRNAAETVRRVAPFPPPPAKAEITVPVVYALQ
jgi:periplasmic protein TonB